MIKVILYNSYTDKMMPMSYKDFSIVETLMENLFVFEEKYPLLYRSFVNSGFIIQDDMDELALIKLRNKYAVYANQQSIYSRLYLFCAYRDIWVRSRYKKHVISSKQKR